MKPCSKNRKLLAWLAAEAVESNRASVLRAHLETCPGCRAYLEQMQQITNQLGSALPGEEITPSPKFHQKLTARLRREASDSVSDRLRPWIRRLCMDWRVAVPAVGTAVVLAVSLLALRRGPVHSLPMGPTLMTATKPQSPTDVAPTLANYQVAAHRSLEQFDQLIQREADRRLPPAPVYTASSLAP